MNRRAALVAVLGAATIGILFVAARGPLRSFFGDVVVVVFLVAALAAVRLGSPSTRLIGVGGFALGIELLQALRLVGPESHWLLHLTVGSTADPLDVLAYALGLGLAAGAEAWYAR